MKYLAFGGGVNSTALLILLAQEKEEFEAIFSDHGGDYPETYEYVKLLQSKGYAITIVEAKVEGKDLYNYSIDKKVLPSRLFRWCTDKFKIRPMLKYYKRPCTVYLGIDAGESHRAKQSGREDVINEFPLVARGIDRAGCVKIIQEAGLPVPRKSGCYFCPYTKKAELVALRDTRPELYCKAKKLENQVNDARTKEGRSKLYIRDKPIEVVVDEKQDDLFGLRKPCYCDL